MTVWRRFTFKSVDLKSTRLSSKPSVSLILLADGFKRIKGWCSPEQQKILPADCTSRLYSTSSSWLISRMPLDLNCISSLGLCLACQSLSSDLDLISSHNHISQLLKFSLSHPFSFLSYWLCISVVHTCLRLHGQ